MICSRNCWTRSRSCDSCPVLDWRRSSKNLCSPVSTRAKSGSVFDRASSAGGKIDFGFAVAFRFKPDLADEEFVDAPGDDGEVDGSLRGVEADEDVARLDAVAFANAQFADDAAGGMLHLLDVAFDDDHAGHDDGAGNVRRRSPDAEAADEDGDDGGGRQEMAANG